MALSTDLSRSPYYDDFNIDKNFYRVLYRPGTSVQTRELNQMQTILQDQIDKFGRHVFAEGSVVEGCSFTFDNSYEYVKIGDTFANGYAFTITDFQDKYVYNSNGLKAIVVNTVGGYIAQNPDLNTLYIKYLNVGTFANGSSQNAFLNNEPITVSSNQVSSNTTAIIGTVSAASVANTTGKGYAFTTTQGTIFQKGFFVNVRPQTLIVSKYSNSPTNISVGFNSIESVITPEADTSLLDNAAGAPNYAAPGAHRLQLVPTLYTTITSDLATDSSFFSLVDFNDGVPVSIRNTPEYNILGKQLAQRTYETNGNFIVSPFLLSTDSLATTNSKYQDYNALISSRGLGYVEGYRVEFVNNIKVLLRKGIDTEVVKNQIVSANYGNYIYVNEYCGDFDTEHFSTVELHNVAKTSISSIAFLGVGYSDTTKIGTALVKAVVYDSGNIGTSKSEYRLYLAAVNMNPGQNFADVRSIIRYSSSEVKAVADVILTYNATLQASIATAEQTKLGTMIFPLGQQAIKPDGFNNTQYVYRNQASAQILNNGTMTVGLPAVVGTGSESFLYSGNPLNNSEVKSFIVIPTANVSTANKTGTVSVTSASKIVSGTGTTTTFDTTYRSGDFIKINSEIHVVNVVVSSNSLIVNENFSASATNVTHSKAFIVGVPIDFTQPNRSVSVVGSTATFALGEVLSSGATLQTYVYHDILRTGAVSINKTLTRNALIKIDCSNNVANSTGPWSLGLPDIQKINGIYIGTNHVYSNSSTAADSSESFVFNRRQTDNFYGLGSIRLKNNVFKLLDDTSTILVDVDVFKQDRSQGVGFFTSNSYPINDAPSEVERSTTIYTQEIPKYTSSSLEAYDLRDSVDYRPYMSNTALVTTNISTSTINPSATEIIDLLNSGSYIPSINTNWQSDIEHYLPRKDIAVIDTKGKLKIIEGNSDNNPAEPLKPAGVMTLGIINIPPYPSLTPKQAKLVNRYDYSISMSITQNRRYTMADIGTLAKRIDNLEYYTSLNLLEQSTTSMLVKNDTTGLNRFKNGILVDPFAGHDIGDTLDPNYNIAIDPSARELRPKFSQRQEVFDLDTDLSTGVVQKGPLVLLDYDEVEYISQSYASKYRNCIEGNIYVWKTNVILTPNYQLSPSLTKSPDVIGSLDLSANWINVQKAFGTQWGNWQTVSSIPVTTVGNKTLTGSRTVPGYSGTIQTYTERSTTVTTTNQTRSGTELKVTGYNDTRIDLGTNVTDVNILPYIQSAVIKFAAVGLKPGARVYPYFNNIAVSSYCRLANDITIGDIIVLAGYGNPLIVNQKGGIEGYFEIPANKFQSTELTFMLCDVDNLTTGFNSITTQSTGTFYATNLSIAKGSSVLNTRDVTISAKEVTQQQTLVTSTTGDQSSVTVIPGPIIPPFITRPPIITPVINIISPWIPPAANGVIISVDTGNWGTYENTYDGGGGGGGGACSGYGGYSGYGDNCGCDSTPDADPGDAGEGDDGEGEGDSDADGGDGDGGDE